MSKQRVHKPTFSNYTVAKKSSPLIQTRPWTNPHQQVNAENAQKPANTVKPQTAEEWKKDNVFLKAIETLEAQQQQEIQTKLTVGRGTNTSKKRTQWPAKSCPCPMRLYKNNQKKKSKPNH